MKYALLIYGPTNGEGPSPDEREAEMPKWFAYTEALMSSGAHLGGEALQPIDAATTLRERDGQRLVTDGPFAETKEILAGFYLIDVEDLDAALEWASKIPNVGYGSIEVRPVVDFANMPEAG
jgi:hypothetical protein